MLNFLVSYPAPISDLFFTHYLFCIPVCFPHYHIYHIISKEKFKSVTRRQGTGIVGPTGEVKGSRCSGITLVDHKVRVGIATGSDMAGGQGWIAMEILAPKVTLKV